MNKRVALTMRIILYITILFAIYMTSTHLLATHNIKIWIALIPIIILELLFGWIKEKSKQKKSDEESSKRYNDNKDL